MLNTDMYNPHVKTKMTLAEFIRNNRGINEESDLPLEYLEDIYQRIRQEEIKLVRDELKLPNAVKKGWIQMLTKGAMGTSWKRRWCVLADDTIHIFKKLEDTNAAVTISLSHYTLTTHLGPSDLKAAQRRKNCLKLLNNMAESLSGSGSKALRDKEPSSYLFRLEVPSIILFALTYVFLPLLTDLLSLSFTSEKEVTSWISTVNAHVHYPQKLKPTASSDHNEMQHSPKNLTSDPPKTKRKEEDGTSSLSYPCIFALLPLSY
jgi:hypothetical protein